MVSSTRSGSNRSQAGSSSDSGWNVKSGKETDTAILRYDRVAMMEAVLSIRDRRHELLRRALVVAALFITGVLTIAAGVFGWI